MRDDGMRIHVVCETCGCLGPWGDTLAEAIEEWNKRAKPDPRLALIEALRADEGSSVVLLCDNPDFNGMPNNAIEVNGAWTDWKDVRFMGDTILDCLEQAHTEMLRVKDK
jgi:hypothetical protein